MQRNVEKARYQGRIARKGIESSEKLGRHRWVVERTLAWLAKYRRLTIRYERRDDTHEVFLHLVCSLICSHSLAGFRQKKKRDRGGDRAHQKWAGRDPEHR